MTFSPENRRFRFENETLTIKALSIFSFFPVYPSKKDSGSFKNNPITT